MEVLVNTLIVMDEVSVYNSDKRSICVCVMAASGDWHALIVSRFELHIIYRPLWYERVYLPLYKVADTPFHIQGDDIALMF